MTGDLPSIGKILEYYGAGVYRSSGQENIKCPFHDDKHASAGVSHKENIFNCFTCGVKGNSLQIIMYKEGVSIREAALIAEGIAGASGGKLHDEYSSGSRLPRKQGHHKGSGTAGSVRSSLES